MGLCDFCKINPKEQPKSCVCRKVYYCSKACQIKDWKAHKASCPPFTIKESPGKGRGLFAIRKIKDGQIILEEYPLLTFTVRDFHTSTYFPNMDEETKAKILQINDPAEDYKTLDSQTVEELISKNPNNAIFKEVKSDEKSKIIRIMTGNTVQICAVEGLYDTEKHGIYHNISWINHSCVPNATLSWVNGDFERKQVRAYRTIKKGEEILVSYDNTEQFIYGSRQFRRQCLLERCGFLCVCSECSLEGWEFNENERMRAEFWNKIAETTKLLTCEEGIQKRSFKKVMRLVEDVKMLVVELNIYAGFVEQMRIFYQTATVARMEGIPCKHEPEIYKQEALKLAMKFGDNYLYICNN